MKHSEISLWTDNVILWKWKIVCLKKWYRLKSKQRKENYKFFLLTFAIFRRLMLFFVFFLNVLIFSRFYSLNICFVGVNKKKKEIREKKKFKWLFFLKKNEKLSKKNIFFFKYQKLNPLLSTKIEIEKLVVL